MAYETGGTPGTEGDMTKRLKVAQSHLAAYRDIVRGVDEDLADPADLRPKEGPVDQRRAQAAGKPMVLRQFDRAAFERGREELVRLLEVALQHLMATSPR